MYMVIEITGNLSEEPIHYVYLHTRNDTNCVFYVGKGKNRRAWSKGSRNKHWKHITEKHGYSVEIIKKNLTELEAFEMEIDTISKYGLGNLVNLTLGGHTSTGYEHTEETRQRQSKIAKDRLLSNIEWRDTISDRIRKLNNQQRDDPSFYKKLSEQNSLWYSSLTEEQKLVAIAKKTDWLKDPLRKSAMLLKLAATRESVAYKEKMSKKAKAWWANLTPEQREVENYKRGEAMRKGSQYRTGVLSTSTTYIVNRQTLIPSIKKCSDIFGIGVAASVHEMNTNERSLTLFKGFVIEIYDKTIHTEEYTTDIEQLVPLQPKRWNPKSAVKDSSGNVFLSISEAACSFGEKKTESTADWISQCIRKNKMAMGFYWSRPTNEECEQKLLSLLKEQTKEINE